MKQSGWTRLTKAPGGKKHQIHYDMEVHYFRQIEGVEVDFGPMVRSDTRMMAHVQIIIWGALMVESFANRFRRGQLTEQMSSNSLSRLWEREVVKESTIEKLANASSRFAAVAPPAWLDSELRLRNRLIHFKDRPVLINLEKHRKKWKAAGAPGEFLEHLPPMGIHAHLLKTPIETRKDRFLEYGHTLHEAAGTLYDIRGID